MNVGGLILSFALSLGITELIEIALGWILGVKSRSGILLIFLANLMTNPPLVFIYYLMTVKLHTTNLNPWVYALEIIILLAEALLYARTPWMLEPENEFRPARSLKLNRFYSALLMSFILNLSSYTAGVIINYL